MKVVAIVPAAGQGRRMGGGRNKLFLPLARCPILVRTLETLAACRRLSEVIVVAAPDEAAQVEALLGQWKTAFEGLAWRVVSGGAERQHSVANALAAVPADAELVMVHDGARPLTPTDVLDAAVDAAAVHGAVVAAVPVKDTIKRVEDARVAATPARDGLWAVQTPQVFRRALLARAYEAAQADGFVGTDDASLVERLGEPVMIVNGSYRNLKVTTPEDLLVAEALFAGDEGGRNVEFRVGTGYDVHRLTPGRRLVLGGVDVPYTLGLAGHSDADVLLHALKDALLGAAGLGDIGRHFPDNDPAFKDISSLVLLKQVAATLHRAGWRVNNVDVTAIAEAPKLAPYVDEMAGNIARVLNMPRSAVNVKATTTEKLGFTGRGEGIAAQAVVSIVREAGCMEEKQHDI